MYDKDKIKSELTLEEIKMLLTELGTQHIETYLEKGHIITNTICHNISDGKMKLYYYLEEKTFHCYTDCGSNFDIYDLVIKNHSLKGVEMNLTSAINWILRTLGKETRYENKPQGFIHTSGRLEEIDWFDSMFVKKPVLIPMKSHSDLILKLFSDKPHPAFLEDGISEETMKKFEIMYYEKTNRIVIPHRHHETGEIIGLKSRSLNFDDIDKGFKYIPMKIQEVSYSYPTFQNLYGLYQNKDIIKKIKKVIIFESEKSVMQFESFFPNQNFSVALCGSNISKLQVEMLLDLGVEEVIVALDKEFSKLNSKEADINYDKLTRLCRMFSSYTNVSMIFDKSNLLELKDSPSDRGRETFIELFKKRKTITTLE